MFNPPRFKKEHLLKKGNIVYIKGILQEDQCDTTNHIYVSVDDGCEYIDVKRGKDAFTEQELRDKFNEETA